MAHALILPKLST